MCRAENANILASTSIHMLVAGVYESGEHPLFTWRLGLVVQLLGDNPIFYRCSAIEWKSNG